MQNERKDVITIYEIMKGIHRHTNFSINKLIRYRGLVSEIQLKAVIKNMNDHIKINGAQRIGSIIVAIHVLHIGALDIEVFLTIDKEVPSTEEFNYLPMLEIGECISTEFKGVPFQLPNLYTEMYYWARNRSLDIIYPYYIVFKSDPECIWGMCGVEAGVWVGVGKCKNQQ
ncbi:MAG: DUF5085 family protein [Defluviitaleaceae bacterium]|nr:DUF5085 family protein [Defluviitaleaceae bacterium]